jgi:hypothetical protein
MSKYEEQSTIAFPRARIFAACRTAIERLGWRMVRQDESGVVCTEPPPQNPLSFTTPVQVEIGVFSGTNPNETRIVFRGSNLGLGPIQSNHVKAQVRKLMQELGRAAVSWVPASQPPPPPSEESGKRSVIINSVKLSDDQIEVLENAYRVRIQDGDYWYDPMTGGWGLRGGPTSGVMQAGLTLGGPLPADASNGNTGVFINGRQLPVQDLMLLQQVLSVPIWPGRYWLDARGNCGFEGGPMMGNIFESAQQSNTPRQGILSTYDKVGMVVIG